MPEYRAGDVEELARLLRSLFQTTERLPVGPERASAFRQVDDFRERVMAIIRQSETSSGGDDRSLGNRRVLIVEDEYFVANDLEHALRSRGADVIRPRSDFDGAYLNAERDHFEVAIIDVNLHSRSAYPIADELIRQGVPFIFCTGYSASMIPKRFAGIRVWQKPFDVFALVEYIGQMCRDASDRRNEVHRRLT